MRRNICWVQKLEDRVKREVRVTVSRDSLKWQFKRSDEERWDYDSAPTAEEWDRLAEEVERRSQRRLGYGEREKNLLRTLRAKQGV